MSRNRFKFKLLSGSGQAAEAIDRFHIRCCYPCQSNGPAAFHELCRPAARFFRAHSVIHSCSFEQFEHRTFGTVSYTHLTLPTICSV
eukprot:11148165-Alexandrium_andersonii.AAC.1